MSRVIVYNRYPFTQTSPSFSWTVQHNLDVIHPVVDVWILENNGTYVNSDAHEVKFTNSNTVVITFFDADIPPRGIALIT